jgi:soluble lytic murein transglycosylase-like protein
MPRARPEKPHRQTAAAPQQEGSGCLSGFTLVPLSVILISALLATFAWKTNPSPVYLPPVTTSSTSISPIFRIEIHYWANSISKWAAASQLDPNLVATIMQIESCGDPRAKSSAGAMGLFQVMPFHFYAIDNPYNPDTNAARGLAYLARSFATGSGDARLAMAGYNGGIGVIPRAEWTWSAQTKRYVQYGLPIYEDARSGLASSPALNEWYEKYGVSLCRQAHQRLSLP